MVITKAIAEEIATKLATPIFTKMTDTEKEISLLVTEHVKTLIPSQVLNTFQKYSEHFTIRKNVQVSGVGLSRIQVSMTNSLPFIGWQIDLPNRLADKVSKLENKRIEYKEKHLQTKNKIASTLLGLRTYKRISENIPEAIPYLPDVNKNTSVILPIKEVRGEIKHLAKQLQQA